MQRALDEAAGAGLTDSAPEVAACREHKAKAEVYLKTVAEREAPSTPPRPRADEDEGAIVYQTRTGKKYHRSAYCGSGHCSNGSPLSLREARNAGLTPCKHCYK
jgi:hypothetical protein